MRILAVIPHYFGRSHPENNLPSIGSYIEPLGRIAALNDVIVNLHQNFGPNRYTYEGTDISAAVGMPPSRIDIVIMTLREHNLLAELGLAEGTFEIAYVDEKPPFIAFHAQDILKERFGGYDFYCFLEDDLIIRDPAFFEKLRWFQNAFGMRALLAPRRFEMSARGNVAKIAIDPVLPDVWAAPFRRAGQREEISADWNARKQTFRLPSNPHSGCFFLTEEQMKYWMEQPSFRDRDASWAGPIESAGTLSVGKVFDIYKSEEPDPFFLEIQHSGTRYASRQLRDGRTHGEPPLLAIAQNALRAAIARDADAVNSSAEAQGSGPTLSRLVSLWLAQGTAVEQRAEVERLELALYQDRQKLDELRVEIGRLQALGGSKPTTSEVMQLQSAPTIHGHSLPGWIKPPLVSVVLVNWNHEKYVGAAIESIRAQDYPWIECFVVDNASTDNSRAVIEKSVAGDPRFTTIFRQDNVGQMGAIAELIDRVSGDLIAFIDSDDLLLENFVSCHVQVHLASPKTVALSSNKVIEVNESGHVLSSGTIGFANGCEIDSRGLKAAGTVVRLPGLSESDYTDLGADAIAAPYWRVGAIWSPGTANMYRTRLIKLLWPSEGITRLCATEGYFNPLCHALTGTMLIDRTLSAYRIHGANRLAAMEAMNSVRTSRKENDNEIRDDRRLALETLTSRADAFDWLMYGDRFWFALDQQSAGPREGLSQWYALPEVQAVLAKHVAHLVKVFGFQRVLSELHQRLTPEALRVVMNVGPEGDSAIRRLNLARDAKRLKDRLRRLPQIFRR